MLYRFFAGDFPITVVIYGIMWFATRGRWSLLRDLMFGDTPFWNRLGQVTLGAVLIFPLWVAAADNWRQLLSYSPFLTDRWQSDPFQTTATPLGLRLVTVALGVILVLGLATLYARHRGGISAPIIAVVLGAALLNFIDPIRMRVDVLMLQTQADLSTPQVFDSAFILFWAMGLYLMLAVGILAAVGLAWGATSLPAKLVYWLATRNRSVGEVPVFHVYQRRVEQLHADGPGHDAGSPTPT
ncbi:MAG TPA: hypothetical protein VMU89_18255 [Thermomicrobiaceae bacterium]|nr:hypothetical protein [Thermomicrobiaceae bacterium]